MRDGWSVLRLGDAVEIKHGFAFSGSEFSTDPSYPTVVTPGNFRIGGGFQQAKVKTFTDDVPDGFVLEPGELIVTMTDLSKTGDTLGYPAFVPGDRTYLHNQRIGKVILRRQGIVDLRYVALVMQTSSYRAHVLGSASGSTVLHTSPSRILDFKAAFPPLDEQRRIASVLGALDDLIDANRRIAGDCTSLWRALVRDALADASDSTRLSDLADFVNGKNFTQGASGHGRPVIRTPEVRRGPGTGTVRSDVDAADENVAREGDTLFVWSGSLTVGRWMWEEGLINQHVFKVLPKRDIPAWLIFALIEYQMPWFLSLAADKATTMGHIKREHLDAEVSMPSRAKVERLGGIVEPLWNEALVCSISAEHLTRARDELLPLLLSGRVRVEDVAA
jgi:type I restriction enzyme, S subunit